MTHNQILSIYCSKEDCFTILREDKTVLQDIHLDMTIVKTQPSLKKVYMGQRNRYSLQKGDYIIAIDHPDICLFKKNYTAENLLHFTSIYHFFKWLDKKFE